MLRAAVNFDVLAVDPGPPPRFAHTECSRLLMDSHPRTIWPMARPTYRTPRSFKQVHAGTPVTQIICFGQLLKFVAGLYKYRMHGQ